MTTFPLPAALRYACNVTMNGNVIKRTILTAGVGNHVLTAYTHTVIVAAVGGGGGGGGTGANFGRTAPAGGGSSGSYGIAVFSPAIPGSSCPYDVGAGGPGGVGLNDGGDGDDSTFGWATAIDPPYYTKMSGLYTLICFGGNGGLGAADVAGESIKDRKSVV